MDRASPANFLVRVNAFAPFRFLNRGKLPVVMYHRFSQAEEFGKTSLSVFENHLDYLTRCYKVISLNDAISHLGSGSLLPPRSVVITIDDGYRDFYEIAFPVLRQRGLPATLYAVTDFVDQKCWIWTDIARFILTQTVRERINLEIEGKLIERHLGNLASRLSAAGSVNTELKKLGDGEKDRILAAFAKAMGVEVPDIPPSEFDSITWDKAREMEKAGIDIGSHTATHPILTNVDEQRLESELMISRTAVQEKLQKDAVHFCYPNGNVSRRERDAAEKAGYASAVTTEIRLCENGEDTFLLPRIDAEPELHRLVQATSGFDRIRSSLR